MLFLVLLEGFPFGLKQREVHKRVSIFVEGHHQASEVHLARHFEIEEIAVHIDAALHQVVVDNGAVEFLHEEATLAIDVSCAVNPHHALQFIEVKAIEVHIEFGADSRNGVFF